MRYLYILILVPSLAGCVDDEFLAPPPPPMPVASSCGAPPPVANSCSAPYRPVAYSSPLPQTQEPPR